VGWGIDAIDSTATAVTSPEFDFGDLANAIGSTSAEALDTRDADAS
jgi:hypothetical protein